MDYNKILRFFIFAAVMLICLQTVVKAQASLHVDFYVKKDTGNLVTLWNANKPSPDITTLYTVFKKYNIALYTADSTFYMCDNALFTGKRQIQAGFPVFLGGNDAYAIQKNWWYSKLNTSTDSIKVSIDIWER